MQGNDDEVLRIAQLWRDRLGDDALSMARGMVSELKETGAMDEADLWLRVIVVLGELDLAMRDTAG